MTDLQKWLDRKQGEWHDETLDALRAVVELHQPAMKKDWPLLGNDELLCDACGVAYPCPTIRAIEREVLRMEDEP